MMRAQETRPVRSSDPSLSPRASELLTEELRESLGGFLRTTMIVERMDPAKAAVPEEEGVADPDLLLSVLAEDYRGDAGRKRTEVTPSAAPPAPDGASRRGAPAGESALSIGTLAILMGVAVVTFMVAVSFVDAI